MPPAPAEVPIPAIRYASRAVLAGRPLIVGLTVAMQTFFEAFVRANRTRPIVGYLRDEAALEDMRGLVGELGGIPGLARGITARNRDALAECGALLMQDPGLRQEARMRQDPRAYSLVGTTHSLSSLESWNEISNYLMAPLQPWDAIVCTSRAARATVDGLLDAAEAILAEGGAKVPLPRPARPIIPLGVDADALAPDPALRPAWRARHGIAEGEVVVLYFGRLSMHAKAHPYAMFAAVGEAARRLPTPPRFVLAGQFATPGIRNSFQELAADHARLFPTTFIEGPDNAERHGALSGADIFVSLADSIQETFGLAPVEAMAAGLPVVATDWDGYRDTIRNGIDGFRIATLMASPPAADGILASYLDKGLNYDRFCAVMGQMVAVNIRAAAEAIRVLASEPERRREMGRSGIARVRSTYDWPAIMERWRMMWTGLARIRAHAPLTAPLPPVEGGLHRLVPDPLALFRSFASRSLGEGDRLHLTHGNTAQIVAACHTRGAFRYAFTHLPDLAGMGRLVGRLGERPGMTVRELLAEVPPDQHGPILRALLFLAKCGLLRVEQAA
ncbi:hypothetical protein STVA_40600 [Allostella vacuolata]|nr:hypothetical protein STVA_40600 [Stella vacuolata]